MFKCNLCDNDFIQKKNLTIHLKENRCKSDIISTYDYVKVNNFINEKINKDAFDKQIILDIKEKELKELKDIIDVQKKEIEDLCKKMQEASIINANGHSQINSKCNNVNNINMKIEIIVNSINKLDVNYIDPIKWKNMIETYDDNKELKYGKEKFNSDKVNIILGDYIKDIICNSNHPENHSVKYIKKKPPTYNSIIEDSYGNTITVIKGIKDTCELLSDPILNKLKKKMIEFCKKYYKDELPEFDYGLYENAIKELKKELNKANVKKALNSVLKNDILNNIEMKLTKST